MVKSAIVVLLIALCSGCAGNYRLVKTTQMEAINQCAIASEHNHQILLEQQQALSQGLDDLLSQLENSRPSDKTSAEVHCPEPIARKETPQQTPELAADVQRVGATERVRFDSLNLILEARIDTGIATAVLGVSELVEFERNGENWVRFNLLDPNNEEPKLVELRSPRRQSMQLRNGQNSSRRPVVSLPMTLGKITQVAEFILVDGKNREYPVLLGRQVLRDVMLVDVSRNHLAKLPPPPKTKPLRDEVAP